MVLGLNEMLTGSRVLRGMVAIGGVRRDWQRTQVEAIESTLAVVEREFRDLVVILQASNSTRHRLERTGILRPEKASNWELSAWQDALPASIWTFGAIIRTRRIVTCLSTCRLSSGRCAAPHESPHR